MQKIIIKIRNILDWVFWPILYLFLHDTKRSRVVIRAGNEVLLIKGWGGDWFSLPGGGAKKGESIEGCAKREVLEEVGIDLKDQDLVELGSYAHRAKNIDLTLVGYSVILKEKPEVKLDKKEVRSAQWIDMDQAKALEMHPHTKVMITKSSSKQKQG